MPLAMAKHSWGPWRLVWGREPPDEARRKGKPVAVAVGRLGLGKWSIGCL